MMQKFLLQFDHFKINNSYSLTYNLQDWANQGQPRFNATKCKVMHLGGHNARFDYTMQEANNTIRLKVTKCGKDLGVHIDNDLSFKSHAEKIVKKSNRIVGMIRRSFTFMDCDMFRKLFSSLVRPHLEYGNAVWAPGIKKTLPSLKMYKGELLSWFLPLEI